MELKVDRDLCESTAVCVGIAPDIFSLGDDDLAQVPVGEVQPAREAAIPEAAAMFPKMELSLHTDKRPIRL